MIELAIAIVIFGGLWVAKTISDKRRISQLALEARRKELALRNSLKDVRGGVWIREPNGSEHIVQNKIEQELSRRGMALFNLRNEPVQTLVKTGEWNPEIAASHLDVAIIGRIKTAEREVLEYGQKPVQHVDTQTGRRFDALPKDHPNYRKANSSSADYLRDYTYDGLYPIKYYFEPHEEYKRRCQIESQQVLIKRSEYTLDIRFYGPQGQIRGGSIAHSSTQDQDPISVLVNKLVEDLASSVKPSIDAHDRSNSISELYSPMTLPVDEEEHLRH